MQMARGESETFTFTCTDSADAAIDLAGATIAFTVTDLEGATVLELTSAGEQIEITPNEGETISGTFTVEIAATDSDLDPTARWADCVVVTGAGQTIKVTEREPFYITGT